MFDRSRRFFSFKMSKCDTVSSFCGHLILTNQVSDSKNGGSPINIAVLRFDSLKEQTLKYFVVQMPQVLRSSRNLEFKFVYHNVFEIIDLETNLKHLYILFVLKNLSDSQNLFVRLFRLVDFRTLNQQLEFELNISVEQFDGKSIHVFHGPIVCYANLQEILIFNKDGKVTIANNIHKFVYLDSKCNYNRKSKCDELHIVGKGLASDNPATNTQPEDVNILDLIITFAGGDLQVRQQPLNSIFSIYAPIIECMLVLSNDGDDDVLSGDVVVATSLRQLILFANGDFKMATDLPFGEVSRIVEFVSSSGCKYFLVAQEANALCCIVNASNFEVTWTLVDQSERWSAHVDDFIGYGSHQVLFLKIPSNKISSCKTNEVPTIIDEITIDDDDDDDGNPNATSKSDFDNDPKNWKYFLDNFSGIQLSNHLSRKEKELFNMCHDDDDDVASNPIPAVVLEALNTKHDEAFLRLEESRREKYSKMEVLRDVHKSMTSRLAGDPHDLSVSHGLVNLFNDDPVEVEGRKINDEVPCLEVAGDVWQGIFMDKWIMAVPIRNNSKDRKVFNVSLNCLKVSSHVDEYQSLENVETHAFKMKSTETMSTNVEFILEFLASQKSSQNDATSSERKQNSEFVCSEDREYLKVLLPRGDECFAVCSVDVPILIASNEISCALHLHWNEVEGTREDIDLKDFLFDIHFASDHVKHVGIVKFNGESFDKLLVKPESLDNLPHCFAGRIYAMFGATLNSIKLEFESRTCNSLLNVVTSIFLDKLKFIFVHRCGFFWSDGSSYLNKCAVFITKAASNNLSMTIFYRNSSQLGFLVDQIYQNFRGNLDITTPRLLKKSEFIDKIYENLKKESLLINKASSANPGKNLNNDASDTGDLIALRMKFERKRKRMESLEVQNNDKHEECKNINSGLVECMRQTDQAVSFFSALEY